MQSLWKKVLAFIAKLFGLGVIPPEITNTDSLIQSWFDIYRCKAVWLSYNYVTADGIKRNRTRMTLNPARIVCSEMAGLVLAETPDLQGPSTILADLLKAEDFWTNLRQSLEYQGALGGQAIKLYATDGKLHLDFVRAYNFIPLTWDNSQITEATFLDRRTKGDKAYIRVETHRRAEGGSGYTITSKAFDEMTGLEVPLSGAWDGLEAEVSVAIDEPLFVYIRNPEANNLNPESPMGLSIFANAVDTIQTLDIAFDGMKTELLMGRQRVALPGAVMRRYLDPESNTYKQGFDPTDEAYIRLEGDDADKLKPSDLSGQLRMEQWKLAIQMVLDLLAVQTGFDSGYFAFDGQSVKTATEVISENSHTYKTMKAYRDVLNKALEQLFRVVNKLAVVYKLAGSGSENAQLIWDDGVIEDRNSRAKYHEDLVQNKLEDRLTAIMKVHGLDETAAKAMYDRIEGETPKIVTDPFGPIEGKDEGKKQDQGGDAE